MNYKMVFQKLLNLLVALISVIYLGVIPVSSVNAAAATIRYVAITGSDSGNCSSVTSPCRTIQYAVNQSSSGNMILVAQGIYTYKAQVDTCSQQTNMKPASVVCFVDKSLTILGGYSTTNWSAANPSVNLTVIDGQNTYRGVADIGYLTTTASLDMEGFTIQNGMAQGPTAYDTSGIGGGMLVQHAAIVLKDMVFKNNQAKGQNTSSGPGGQADGAAIRIESAPAGTHSLLQRVIFDNNQSYGGTGPVRGGIALGALFIYATTITIEDSIFTNNLAQAGSSTGNGTSGGLNADALGGAIGIEVGGTIIMQRITITGNQINGGNASENGGGAYGAGILVEDTTSFSISDAYVANNTAIAGNARTGGNAAGGAITGANNGQATFERVKVISNTANGGNSTAGGNTGTGAGGGMYIFATHTGTFHATLNNMIIAENQANQGSIGVTSLGNGSGGGIVVHGMNADITHATFARNRLGSNLICGLALAVQPWGSIPATVNLKYSIIADHTEAGTPNSAILVSAGATLNLTRGLFAGNTHDTNSDNIPVASGTFIGLDTMLSAASAGFVSPGAPNHDYHILAASAAKDQATGSATPVDIDNQPRPFGTVSDIGADEYALSDLLAIPNSFSATVDNNNEVSRSAQIDVTPDTLVNWTATTTVTWLYLGPSGTLKQFVGQTGDNLIIRFAPGRVGFGSYDATILISSPSAVSTSISVHLLKVDLLYEIYLPLVIKT
jgi:hypothetical protein